MRSVQKACSLCLTPRPSEQIFVGWLGFPGGSDGKESTHNAGDLVSISGTFETTLFQHGASSRNSPSQCQYVHFTWSLVHINL